MAPCLYSNSCLRRYTAMCMSTCHRTQDWIPCSWGSGASLQGGMTRLTSTEPHRPEWAAVLSHKLPLLTAAVGALPAEQGLRGCTGTEWRQEYCAAAETACSAARWSPARSADLHQTPGIPITKLLKTSAMAHAQGGRGETMVVLHATAELKSKLACNGMTPAPKA